MAVVRYFAYGANVAPASMARRGTAPAGSARPATVKDYRLTFRVPGAPYVEPGFATIVRKDEAGEEEDGGLDVRGVVYDLTEEDWERVRATETGYEVVEVEVAGSSQTATTLVYPRARCRPGLLPSRRYLSLIREGAAYHSIDLEWRAYLASLDYYDPSLDEGRALGAALSLVGGLAASPLVVGTLVSQGADAALAASAELTWGLHDSVIRGLVGTGGGDNAAEL